MHSILEKMSTTMWPWFSAYLHRQESPKSSFSKNFSFVVITLDSFYFRHKDGSPKGDQVGFFIKKKGIFIVNLTSEVRK